ncbi:hypothetical protein BGX24_006072 [Mortierella sp. AD032]|nr:hypothetical protein BGX24_006072 [Mortierella sp. AD032]
MQFKSLLLVCGLLSIAAANPTPRKTCDATVHKQACCDGLLNVACLIQLVTSTCTNTAYCCETGDSVGGLINVNAANCFKLQ